MPALTEQAVCALVVCYACSVNAERTDSPTLKHRAGLPGCPLPRFHTNTHPHSNTFLRMFSRFSSPGVPTGTLPGLAWAWGWGVVVVVA